MSRLARSDCTVHIKSLIKVVCKCVLTKNNKLFSEYLNITLGVVAGIFLVIGLIVFTKLVLFCLLRKTLTVKSLLILKKNFYYYSIFLFFRLSMLNEINIKLQCLCIFFSLCFIKKSLTFYSVTN